MSITIEDWNPEGDPFLKQGEISLHQFLHSSRSEEKRSAEFILKQKQFRWSVLQDAIGSVDDDIGGRIIEVGAGEAWCSAAVMANYPVNEACIMEIDDAAVQELIPSTLEAFGVVDREITVARGSFNQIPHEKYFDFAFAMGALHHSANLYSTFRSLYKSLKPGGILFSQEPCMHDDTPNSFYFEREDQVATFQEGIEIKNKERSDTFYRECEYRAAALHAGFDLEVKRVRREVVKEARLDALLKKIGLVRESRSEDEAIDYGKPYNVFLCARRPRNEPDESPVTAWEVGADTYGSR